MTGSQLLDSIYVLDLHEDTGWIEVKHIRCPMASNFVATIGADYDVHLLTQSNKRKVRGHFAVSILSILEGIKGHEQRLSLTLTQVHSLSESDRSICFHDEPMKCTLTMFQWNVF